MPVKKLAVAPALLCFALSAFAADEAVSPPVGGMTITFQPGSRFTGMTLVNPAAFHGAVTSSTSSVITVSGSTNIGALLNASTKYYVEFTGGSPSTYVGDRFEVDVAATRASANNTITISLGDLKNTMASLPTGASLSGYSAAIRPHVTIGQLFGTLSNPIMNGSTIVSSADQVLLYNTQLQSFETYYFLRNAAGTIMQWTRVGGGSTNRDNEVIPPGAGMVVVRNTGTPVSVSWTGEVRTHAFAQPLVAGNNLVAHPFPIDASPSMRSMTVGNGMTGSTSVGSADTIQFPVAGVFRTYYLLRNASGTVEQWTLVGGGSTNRSNELLFSSSGAVVLNKKSADANYVVPFVLPPPS